MHPMGAMMPPPGAMLSHPMGGQAPVIPRELMYGPHRMAEKNDYCQYYVDTGQYPSNFVRDPPAAQRYVQDAPKMQQLVTLKDKLFAERSTEPMCLRANLRPSAPDALQLSTTNLGCKFDVIYMDPPWKEYVQRPGVDSPTSYWTLDELKQLRIGDIADTPAFIFIWAGSGGCGLNGERPHLDDARELLKLWRFRRCEDITWIKTNRKAKPESAAPPGTLLNRVKEHCLMGIRGTVVRNTDGDLIHANIDTDVLVAEEEPDGSTRKPLEMYSIIEHFCLGRRRLRLFGGKDDIRPGWLSIDPNISRSNFNKDAYSSWFDESNPANAGKHPDGSSCPCTRVGSTKEIEHLRPKSPPRGFGEAKKHGYGLTMERSSTGKS